MATVTVAFVDDHPVLLDGMAALFSSKGGFEVLARGTNAQAAMDIAAQHGPDILFLDLSMPGKVFEAIGSIAVSSKNVSLRRRPPCDSGAWRRFCTHKDAVKSAA